MEKGCGLREEGSSAAGHCKGGVQGWGGGTVVSVMERPWGFRPRSPYIGLLALWVGHSSVCEVGEAD